MKQFRNLKNEEIQPPKGAKHEDDHTSTYHTQSATNQYFESSQRKTTHCIQEENDDQITINFSSERREVRRQ